MLVQYLYSVCIYNNVRYKCLVVNEVCLECDDHGVTAKRMLDSASYVILVDTQYREPVVS